MKLLLASITFGILGVVLYKSKDAREILQTYIDHVTGRPKQQQSAFQLASINLTDAEYNFDKVSRELVDAFHSVGFAYLVDNRGFDPDELLHWTKWFFQLPEHYKLKIAKKAFNPTSVNEYRGYFPLITGGHSYKEAFEMGAFEREVVTRNRATAEEIRNMTLSPDGRSYMRNVVEERNVWPITDDDSNDQKFREVMLKYYSFYERTNELLAELLMNGLGYDRKHFQDRFKPKGLSTFRLIHYPTRVDHPELIPAEAWDGDRAIVTGEHFDTTYLTVLATFTYNGLQIKPRGYTKWIDVPADKNKLVINIGALLSHMSNGQLIATNHRVLDIGVDRYSVPMFYEPSYDGDVSKTLDGKQNGLVGKYKKYGPWMTNRTSMFAEYATTDFGIED